MIKMNKKEFIEKLSKELKLDKEKCNKINDILEDTFFISKKNKDKLIDKFIKELEIKEKDANNIYEKVMSIIGQGIKDKIKNPFKDLNKK